MYGERSRSESPPAFSQETVVRYEHPPYSGWREFVLSLGAVPIFVAGLIVGKRYFNWFLTEIFDGAEPIRRDDPGYEKGRKE